MSQEDWKKGDHAFIIAREIKDIIEIKLLEKCAYDPERWIFSVLDSKGKEFNKRSLHYLYFFKDKISALKRYQIIISNEIKEHEEALQDIKSYMKGEKKILSKISKDISKEENQLQQIIDINKKYGSM